MRMAVGAGSMWEFWLVFGSVVSAVLVLGWIVFAMVDYWQDK